MRGAPDSMHEQLSPTVDIFLGDCLYLMREMPAKSVDLTLTSVPFLDKDVPIPWLDWIREFHIEREKVTRDYSIELHSCRREKMLMRYTDPFHWGVWYTKEMNMPYRYQNWYFYRMPGCKYNIRSVGYCWQNHFTFGMIRLKKRSHINQDPIGPYMRLLDYTKRAYFPPKPKSSGALPVVMDPCMGSGTAGKAAIRRGFRFVGIEKSWARYKEAKKGLLLELEQRGLFDPRRLA